MARGVYLVLATAVISGVSIFVNRVGVSGINASVYTWSKNLITALLLFALILFVRKFRELRVLGRRDWLRLAAIGLFGGSIPFLLFFNGLQMTTAARGAFIHKTMFIYVAVLAALLLKERLGKRILIPATLLLAGNAIFLNLPLGLGMGDLLILLATLFWAVEVIISKHTLSTLSPSIVAFGRMFFGAVFLLIFLTATGSIAEAGSLVGHWPWVLLTSGFLFLYVITFYTGLQTVKAHVATSILLLGSPITTLLSATLMNGTILPGHILGTAFLISGVVTMVFLSGRIPEGIMTKLRVYDGRS